MVGDPYEQRWQTAWKWVKQVRIGDRQLETLGDFREIEGYWCGMMEDNWEMAVNSCEMAGNGEICQEIVEDSGEVVGNCGRQPRNV